MTEEGNSCIFPITREGWEKNTRKERRKWDFFSYRHDGQNDVKPSVFDGDEQRTNRMYKEAGNGYLPQFLFQF